ncbi:glycosyltransferase family 9 protein [Rickettsiella grylli]|uniref:Lipopolysaccharide heptosyltransferase III n=1 Tax=Rickettsiella grylli TaxID=59196 RepID=A8PNB2_9COXI|nr:glycosyltransferase family 9 protein [Rickettsiella grylli]EDP47020.1 putative lipopolysaccharide heptosyltransferase III [Rickettsiella grylli]
MPFLPKRILIICTRRLGDVLLATPLIRTFKVHWPKAKIDLLIFKGTESVLNANPDINTIISIEEQPNFSQHYQLVKKIFRRYNLSVSTLPGDKTSLYAFFASTYRIGVLGTDKSRWWKRLLLSKAIPFDNISTHTVLMNLRLAEALQLTPHPEIVITWQEKDKYNVNQWVDLNKKIAILHLCPKFSYKEWTKEGWIGLARWLLQANYRVVLTGDKTKTEKKMAADLMRCLPEGVINTVGHFSLNQLGFLLSQATLYVGPDTVVTHMAAALGTPTLALFGPSNPIKWGPWPKAWTLRNPFVRTGSQFRNNVYLMQGSGVCVPCFQEGCDRHSQSHSRCLKNITFQQVIDNIQLLMDRASI